MKKIAILPTLFTLGNGICGFAAIALASKIVDPGAPESAFWFASAGWLLILAMVFDVLDGFVARLSKSASDFGAELDSLCDAVSFGAAPAFLILKLGPGWLPSPLLHQLIACIASIYLACTVLRLARFNVETGLDAAAHRRFRGLPSPAAAGCIAAFAILRAELPATLAQLAGPEANLDALQAHVAQAIEWIVPCAALFVALLMVSNLSFPHLTGRLAKGRVHIVVVVQILTVVFLCLMLRPIAPLMLFWGYALAFTARALWLRLERWNAAGATRLDETVPPA